MRGVPKHGPVSPYPSKVVTLGILFALKGVGNRAFYHWLCRDCPGLFTHLPDRARLFRLSVAHQDWMGRFLAAPSLLGGADTCGIELLHPMHEGRSPYQIGKEGKSNHRWIVGGNFVTLGGRYQSRLSCPMIGRRATPLRCGVLRSKSPLLELVPGIAEERVGAIRHIGTAARLDCY